MDSQYSEEYDVVSFLEQAGERYREHLAQLVTQRRKEEMAEVTGKPKITPHGAAVRHGRHNSVQERLHELWQKRKQREEKQRNAHATKLSESEMEEVRPDPKITKLARELKPRGTQANVSKKFMEAHNRKMEELHDASVRKEMENVRPRPAINPYGEVDERRRDGREIGDHLMQLEHERQQRLYAAVERSNTVPGSPTISRRAQSLNREGSVTDRLYTPNRNKYAYDEEYARHCTFQPSVSDRSGYQDPLEGLPVHERVLQREVKHFSRVEPFPENELHDRPQLTAKTHRIAEKRKEKDESASMSPTTRLYESRHTPAATPRRHIDPECSFRPTVNAESEKLVKKKVNAIMSGLKDSQHTIGIEKEVPKKEAVRDMLWENAKTKKAKQLGQIRKDKEAAESKEVRKSYGKVSASQVKKFYEREELWTQRRNARVQEGRVETSEGEMANCTFKPSVHQAVPVPVSPSVNASGTAAHLKRMEEARKRKVDATAITKSPGKFTGQPTKPQAFRLGSERRDVTDEISSLRPPVHYMDSDQHIDYGAASGYPYQQQQAGYQQNRQVMGQTLESSVDYILENHDRIYTRFQH